MSFAKLAVENVFIIRWITPESSDGEAIYSEVSHLSKQTGQKLIYVAVAPVDSPPPPDELRKIMAGNVEKMTQWCSSIHLVFEGKGFTQSMKRTAFASIVLISGNRGKMFVHEDIASVANAMDAKGKISFARAMRTADELGFFRRPMAAKP